MSNDYWDGNVDEVYEETRQDGSSTYIRVNGSNINITPGASFVDVVKSTAREAGLGKFRVFLNGSEINPSDAPSIISEGSSIELRPFDVAGV